MKKASLILLLVISLMARVHGQEIKPNSIPLKNDTSEYYKFQKKDAALLYRMLEDYKSFVDNSDDISARKASKVYRPNIASLQKILSEQSTVYEKLAKSKKDSLAKAKTGNVYKLQKKPAPTALSH